MAALPDLVSTPVPPLPIGHDCREGWQPVALARGAPPFADRDFTINACPRCGLGYTAMVPAETDAGSLYASRASDQFQAADSRPVKWLKAMAARRDAASFSRGLDLGASPRILDYGCGNGAFVAAMQRVHPDADVLGSDLHESPPSGLAASQYVPQSRLWDQPRRFDLVLCRHVFEHTYRPIEILDRLRELLRPGGTLVIEVPRLDAAVRRLFGRQWEGFYAPYHTLHFTRASLVGLVRAAGFTVTRVGGADMPMIGRSLQNCLGVDYRLGLFALGMALQPLQVAIGAASGKTACLRLWAQPKPPIR